MSPQYGIGYEGSQVYVKDGGIWRGVWEVWENGEWPDRLLFLVSGCVVLSEQ
jgi:hypothetical protein